MSLPIQSPPIVRRGAGLALRGTGLSPSDTCASITINNGQACVNLPIVGSQCLPLSIPLPDGTAAQACFSICTKWGIIPCGVSVNVTVAGQSVASKSFGCC